jgi:transposase-like protein
MFQPPRCPHTDCRMHEAPTPDFCIRFGSYQPKCRSYPVPRFRCRACKRTFSRQTFRMDYGDHKPDVNDTVFLLLASGIGLRQTARIVGMHRESLAQKFRKIGRHCRRLNRNLLAPLPDRSTLVFDELETYESRRNTRPLTLPIAVDRETRLILDARSAPIRPGGPKTPARLRAIARDKARFGERQSRSRAAVRSILRRASKCFARQSHVPLITDEKSTYVPLARAVFGDRVVHSRYSSKLARGCWNPLFAVNHCEAMMRDLTGRLRRESWLVSKARWYLQLQLHIYMAYRNLVRPRFNGDKESPAQLAGWMPECLRVGHVLSWRQDFGPLSGHPLSMHAAPLGHRLA